MSVKCKIHILMKSFGLNLSSHLTSLQRLLVIDFSLVKSQIKILSLTIDIPFNLALSPFPSQV